MKKAELLNWLQEEYQQWNAFLAQITPTQMEQSGVTGQWSIKDIIAHLNGWQPRLIARIQAAQRGEPEPPAPWPAQLQTDEINAWIYQANRERSLQEVLAESEQLFQQLLAVVEGLPDEILIEPAYHIIELAGQRFSTSEYFDHFHDDHEADIRTWLAQVEQQ